MGKDVKIKIGADTSSAVDTIGDLKRTTKRTFEDMTKAADEESARVSQAFKAMGIRTEKAIKESTRKAKEDYQRIKNSGTASANDIKRAHDRMTQKIERNNKEMREGSIKLHKSIAGLKGPISAVTKTAALLSAAVAGVGVALGVKAFAESVKFEGAVLDLQKVLGDTEGKASDFIKITDDLSTEFGISATDVLAGATAFKQAGFSIRDAFELQRIAIETSIAGGISVEEASERIKASLKGFGAGASEAGRLTDILNEVSNKFGTNLQELAAGVATLSPIARAAGLSMEETAGFLTPIIEVFGSGTEAANALKTGLVKLVRPTKEAAEKLAELGVATTTSNGELRSAKDISFDLAGAFTKLTKEQKLQATAVIFGAEQAARLSTVFSNLGAVTDVTETALNSAGSRVDEVGIRMGSAEAQVEKAKTAFNNMARVIGDQFRGELVGVIGELGGLATKFKELVEGGGLDPIMQKIKPQLDLLKDGIESLSNNLPDLVQATADNIQYMLDVASKIVNVAREIKASFHAALEPFLLLGRGVGFLTDKLGITEVGAETFRIAAEDNRQKFNLGGQVLATNGGHLPGYGGGDTVPVLAEAGEFVVRKEAVKALGVNTISAINRMDISAIARAISNGKIQKFQEGGLVKDQGGQSVNVNLQLNGNVHSMKANKDTASAFLNDIKTINLIHGRGKRPY